MERKGVAFIYEIKSNIKSLDNQVSLCLNDLQDNGAEILDVKTCLNSENDILVTIIYEYYMPICIMPKGHENK